MLEDGSDNLGESRKHYRTSNPGDPRTIHSLAAFLFNLERWRFGVLASETQIDLV
jgi:hypothetical protein